MILVAKNTFSRTFHPVYCSNAIRCPGNIDCHISIFSRRMIFLPQTGAMPKAGVRYASFPWRDTHENARIRQYPSPHHQPSARHAGHRYGGRARDCPGGSQRGTVYHSAVHGHHVFDLWHAPDQFQGRALLRRPAMAGHEHHGAPRHARAEGLQYHFQRVYPGNAASADGLEYRHRHRRGAVLHRYRTAEPAAWLDLLRAASVHDSAYRRPERYLGLQPGAGQPGRTERQPVRAVPRHRAAGRTGQGAIARLRQGRPRQVFPASAAGWLDARQACARPAAVRHHRLYVRMLCGLYQHRVHRWRNAVAEAVRQ